MQYVLADRQMTTMPPAASDPYISNYEPSVTPLPAADLTKFTGPCARVLATFGPISVIDVSRIQDGSCVPRPIAQGNTAQGNSAQGNSGKDDGSEKGSRR